MFDNERLLDEAGLKWARGFARDIQDVGGFGLGEETYNHIPDGYDGDLGEAERIIFEALEKYANCIRLVLPDEVVISRDEWLALGDNKPAEHH